MYILFFKSYVKPHTRKLADGRVIHIGGYNNKTLAREKHKDARTGDLFEDDLKQILFLTDTRNARNVASEGDHLTRKEGKKMDAIVSFKIISVSDVYNDHGMKVLNKRLKETKGVISSIEEAERKEFGESIKYKKVTIEKTGKARIENISTKDQALAKFHDLHNGMTMGGEMSEFNVELVDSKENATNTVVDAEEMLFEMDANNVDEIILREGFDGKTTTITREQVLNQLGIHKRGQMNIEQLRNIAAKDITKDQMLFAVDEMTKINSSIKLTGFTTIDDVLYVNISINVKNGGLVNESLKFGQFVALVESDTSSDARALIIQNNNKLRDKKTAVEDKKRSTRESNKPENNIIKNGKLVDFKEMMTDLIDAYKIESREDRRDYDKRFISDISQKAKISNRQHNYLCKIAEKSGYKMKEKAVRAKAKRQNIACEHEDLGSLGYTHGAIVECPNCGKMAEVW